MTTAPRVIEVNPQADPRWSTFVAAHPEALIYHHPLWLEVIHRGYGHEPACLACEDHDGVFQGVLPLFRMRGLLTGRCLSSLPHTPVAGPLARDAHVSRLLVREAMSRIDRSPGSWLQLKLPAGSDDGPADGLVTVPGQMTFVLELPDRVERLRFGRSRDHAHVAWSVRKAAKHHIEVRPAESDQDLHAWYPLYLSTMRRHFVPPRPWRFFRAMWELLRPAGLMRLLLAEQRLATGTRLIAGSLLLMSGRTVFYAFNGWRRQAQSEHANDAIHWQATHDACREGYRCYDFGEVAPDNHGLAQFKRKWGARATCLYRSYYPASHRDSLALDAPSRSRQLVAAAWRRLPLKVTALLGDHLYRRL